MTTANTQNPSAESAAAPSDGQATVATIPPQNAAAAMAWQWYVVDAACQMQLTQKYLQRLDFEAASAACRLTVQVLLAAKEALATATAAYPGKDGNNDWTTLLQQQLEDVRRYHLLTFSAFMIEKPLDLMACALTATSPHAAELYVQESVEFVNDHTDRLDTAKEFLNGTTLDDVFEHHVGLS